MEKSTKKKMYDVGPRGTDADSGSLGRHLGYFLVPEDPTWSPKGSSGGLWFTTVAQRKPANNDTTRPHGLWIMGTLGSYPRHARTPGTGCTPFPAIMGGLTPRVLGQQRPPPPQGASVQHVAAKGASLRSTWVLKAREGIVCPLCTPISLNPTLTLTPNPTLSLVLPLPLPVALILALIKTEYWDQAGGGGNVRYGVDGGCMLRDTKNYSRHFDQYSAVKTLPRSLCFWRDMPRGTTPAPLPFTPPPAFPVDPCFGTTGHKSAHFRALLKLVCGHMGPKCLRFAQETCHPALHPHSSPINLDRKTTHSMRSLPHQFPVFNQFPYIAPFSPCFFFLVKSHFSSPPPLSPSITHYYPFLPIFPVKSHFSFFISHFPALLPIFPLGYDVPGDVPDLCTSQPCGVPSSPQAF